MKTPDEIGNVFLACGGGFVKEGAETSIQATGEIMFIPLESTYRQLSKALCGKENAAPSELLQAVSQVKNRLAQVERERDAAVDDARMGTMCDTCEHNNSKDYPNKPCYKCDEAFSYWEWRGICSENTKEGPDD